MTTPGPPPSCRSPGRAPGTLTSWPTASGSGSVDLVDVRELPEWETGHVAGSHHVPLNRLRDVAAVPAAADGRTTAVACAAGVRAAFAASLLRRAGREHVVRVAGGGIPDLGARGIELALGA